MNRSITPLIIALILSAACSHTPPPTMGTDSGTPIIIGSEQRQQVVSTARAMIGTAYQYGGSSPDRGFDCSGLVHYAHDRAGKKVPRTVLLQRKLATPVALSQLQPGDLLFFGTRTKSRHIGIYIGNGEFIHAPSTGGHVRTDRIESPYWKKRILGAGKLIDT
ncbi:MAG: C40 family peptidase [Gammaproteobacteria bacterium]|nr:C40 family peptidase [Gammaproteobacteria bacterium]